MLLCIRLLREGDIPVPGIALGRRFSQGIPQVRRRRPRNSRNVLRSRFKLVNTPQFSRSEALKAHLKKAVALPSGFDSGFKDEQGQGFHQGTLHGVERNALARPSRRRDKGLVLGPLRNVDIGRVETFAACNV